MPLPQKPAAPERKKKRRDGGRHGRQKQLSPGMPVKIHAVKDRGLRKYKNRQEASTG